MRKIGILLTSFVLSLALAGSAHGAAITFDSNGSDPGGKVSIDLFDPAPGNSISLGIDSNAVVGDTGTVLFQANLSIGSLEGENQFSSCLDGADCFTFVAALDVIVTATTATTIELGLDPSGDLNVFNMYANTTPGDNLTGFNFTTGTLILSGSFDTFSSTFTGGGSINPRLDCTGTDNYPGVGSVTGGGTSVPCGTFTGGGSFAGNIIVDLGSLDPNYFQSSLLSLTLAATSQNVLPFGQVNPSAHFSSNAVANGDVLGVGSVGPVNGLFSNTMTQTDANITVDGVNNAVPEPATLTLLGLGLLGSAAARRRQMKKKQQNQNQ